MLRIYLGPEIQSWMWTHCLQLHLELSRKHLRGSWGSLKNQALRFFQQQNPLGVLTPAQQTEPCLGLLAKRDGGEKGHSQQLVWEIAARREQETRNPPGGSEKREREVCFSQTFKPTQVFHLFTVEIDLEREPRGNSSR